MRDCSTADPDATAACRWPFVRMGGQSTYQRSTLTANHGTYFLDTSVSYDTQWQNKEQGRRQLHQHHSLRQRQLTPSDPCSQRSVNVFQGGQTYYMFFLFAKPDDQADLSDLCRAGLHPQGQPRRRRQRSPCHTARCSTACRCRASASPMAQRNGKPTTTTMRLRDSGKTDCGSAPGHGRFQRPDRSRSEEPVQARHLLRGEIRRRLRLQPHGQRSAGLGRPCPHGRPAQR